jgi:predicted RNA-binding protein with PIN domain
VSHDDLAGRREELIRQLSEYGKRRGHDILVVFDGWKSGGAREERLKKGGVRIIYSRLGDTADTVIKRVIGGERTEWIVITSDRDIVAFAWSSGSVPVPSERFLDVIGRAGANTGAPCETCDDEEEEDGRTRKGRSRSPSRKEKAVQRALRKLQ